MRAHGLNGENAAVMIHDPDAMGRLEGFIDGIGRKIG